MGLMYLLTILREKERAFILSHSVEKGYSNLGHNKKRGGLKRLATVREWRGLKLWATLSTITI